MPKTYNIVQSTEESTNWIMVRNSSSSLYDTVIHHMNYIVKDNFDYDPIKFSSVTLQYMVPTNHILEKQNELLTINSDKNLMPLAVRYIDKSGSHYIERPPFKINISYKNARAASPGVVVDTLSIWVPWTLTLIPSSFVNNYTPNSVKIYYSYTQLTDPKTLYFNSFFPNSYGDGRICWSNSFVDLTANDKLKSELSSFDFRYWHSMMFNDYMLGGWNNDLHSRPLAILSNRHGGLASYLSSTLQEVTDEEYKTDFPLVDMFRNTQDYPDLYKKIVDIMINTFHIKRSKVNGAATNSTYDSYITNYDYVKFFSFMSLLSLEETLAFYEQVAKLERLINSRINRSSHNNYSSGLRSCLNGLSIKFSEIVKTYPEELIDDLHNEYNENYFDDTLVPLNFTDIGVRVQDPIVRTISGENPRYSIADAARNYSTVNFIFLFQNTTDAQKTKLSGDSSYGQYEELFCFLDDQGFDFAPLMKFYANIHALSNKIVFVKVDCKQKTYTFHDVSEFNEYIDQLKIRFKDLLESSKKTKTNKESFQSVEEYFLSKQENVFLK